MRRKQTFAITWRATPTPDGLARLARAVDLLLEHARMTALADAPRPLRAEPEASGPHHIASEGEHR